MGAVLQLISMLQPETWESYWPAIKQALAGLSAGSIAYVAGKAASQGLSGLAEKIRSFQPVATPDNPSLPVPNLDLPGIDMGQLESDPNAIDFSRVELDDTLFYPSQAKKAGTTYHIPIPEGADKEPEDDSLRRTKRQPKPKAQQKPKPKAPTKASKTATKPKATPSNKGTKKPPYKSPIKDELLKWAARAAGTSASIRAFEAAVKDPKDAQILERLGGIVSALRTSVELYDTTPSLLIQQVRSFLPYLRQLWSKASDMQVENIYYKGNYYVSSIKSAVAGVGKQIRDLATILRIPGK